MAKDSYWFRHDSTSGRGLRIKKIQHIYGHWGKGVYWDVIEVLREQENYMFDSDEHGLQMLSELIGLKDFNKFNNWFKDCLKLELFKVADGKFFSQVLIDNMKNWETKKTNGKSGGRGNKKQNESETKANEKLNDKLKERIREDKIREDNIIKEMPLNFKGIDELGKEVFFDETYQLEFTYDKDGKKLYGHLRDRMCGGLSEFGIKQHCKTFGIKYVK